MNSLPIQPTQSHTHSGVHQGMCFCRGCMMSFNNDSWINMKLCYAMAYTNVPIFLTLMKLSAHCKSAEGSYYRPVQIGISTFLTSMLKLVLQSGKVCLHPTMRLIRCFWSNRWNYAHKHLSTEIWTSGQLMAMLIHEYCYVWMSGTLSVKPTIRKSNM